MNATGINKKLTSIRITAERSQFEDGTRQQKRTLFHTFLLTLQFLAEFAKRH